MIAASSASATSCPVPDSVSTSHRPASAPSRFAPVSPSIARSRRSYSAGDERRARRTARAPTAAAASAEPIVRPAPSSTNALVARPGRRSSRLKTFVASTSTRRRQQPAPVRQADGSSSPAAPGPSEPAAFSAPVDSSPRSSGRAVPAPAARRRRPSPPCSRRACRRPARARARRARRRRSAAARGEARCVEASRCSSVSGISASSAAASVSTPNGKRQRALAVVGARMPARRSSARSSAGARIAALSERDHERQGVHALETSGAGGRAQGCAGGARATLGSSESAVGLTPNVPWLPASA